MLTPEGLVAAASVIGQVVEYGFYALVAGCVIFGIVVPELRGDPGSVFAPRVDPVDEPEPVLYDQELDEARAS